MPITQGYDDGKGFYKWGDKGKKYYYIPRSEESRKKAYDKAILQMHAILYSQSKSKNNFT